MKKDKIISKREKRHEKGTILVVVLLVSTIMLLLSIPFLFKLSSTQRATNRSFKAVSAFNLAEAGLEHVIFEMNLPFTLVNGIQWKDMNGTLVAKLDNVTTSYYDRIVGDTDIILSPIIGTVPETRTAEATGHVDFIKPRTVDRTVRLLLEKGMKSIFNFPFFVDDSFYSRNNFLVDSYNSNFGPYGEGNQHGGKGFFGMNGSSDDTWHIVQGNSSEIYGPVVAGAGAQTDPDYPNNLSDIISVPKESNFRAPSGMRSVLDSPFNLPSVNVFDTQMWGGQLDLSGWFVDGYDPLTQPKTTDIIPEYLKDGINELRQGSRIMTSEDSGIYPTLTMETSTQMVIKEDVVIYVTGLDGEQGEFWMEGTVIIIEPDASLTLILGNTSFLVENNSSFNDGGKPEDLLILGTDQFTDTDPFDNVMRLENNGDIYAAIYTPRASMVSAQGNANISIFGAFLADSMWSKANIDFHYDEALGDLNLINTIPYWRVKSWQQAYSPSVVSIDIDK
jgi:hypothetical protein